MSTHIDLDTSSMQTRCSILRSTASLDIVSLCLIFDDDERMFELSSCFHIHPEICLEWICDLHSLWYIEKCPPAPDSTMKGCEHMISHRDDFHEMLAHDIFIFMDRHRHIFEYDSLVLKFLSQTMVYDLTIILCTDSCEHLALGFWDTEPVECLFDSIWNIIPRL
jgi:hypothetical protein